MHEKVKNAEYGQRRFPMHKIEIAKEEKAKQRNITNTRKIKQEIFPGIKKIRN